MNKISKNILTLVAVIALVCWAGRYDYADQVVSTMPEDAYHAIKAEMPGASDVEIANEYMNNKKHWDDLALNEYR